MRLENIPRLTFMSITLNIVQRLTFALVKSLTVNFHESRPSWFWRGQSFTRKI